jgi:hypothetical protein
VNDEGNCEKMQEKQMFRTQVTPKSSIYRERKRPVRRLKSSRKIPKLSKLKGGGGGFGFLCAREA